MADSTGDSVRSWRPGLAGVAEVLHARFVEHAYPLHTHDTWTLLLVEDGAVHYDLDRRGHDTSTLVTLLPPHVPHDGRAATTTGFRKKVLYLEEDALPAGFAGRAVDDPELPDPRFATAVRALHARLGGHPEPLDVESRAAVLLDALGGHLARTRVRPVRDVPLARRLRALLDGHVVEGVSLADAATALGVSGAHLVRTFTREVGMPPHAYLTGRRVDLARRLLLSGHRPAEAAVLAGFHDQPHLNRHFRRVLGTTPGRFTA
ncbi:helix-turn-helix transcriptional regulator [Kineococcus rhizosphaerae]|uniref:AraC family transcriptional regulator n=1 Tax=Kineococcus rhizosphaerae TaxID=559628 RepID=A0A2T0R6Q0_9ACTN|nr:AraC family transcriptional regulator [Kineococcus rhizosphaerae]PRY16823.1 AraC family transcriptional regulator [Kineococcus rhizosphaerae]